MERVAVVMVLLALSTGCVIERVHLGGELSGSDAGAADASTDRDDDGRDGDRPKDGRGAGR